MATNLDLKEELIEKARSLGKFRTKKEAVNAALEEFVQKREQLKIVDLFNTIEMHEGYDYKNQRFKL